MRPRTPLAHHGCHPGTAWAFSLCSPHTPFQVDGFWFRVHRTPSPGFQARHVRQGLAKAGVGVTGDVQKLARDFPGLACAGAVCLSNLANQRLPSQPERWSLAREPPLLCQQCYCRLPASAWMVAFRNTHARLAARCGCAGVSSAAWVVMAHVRHAQGMHSALSGCTYNIVTPHML